MPKTAVIYARFSCNKQREASIDDQLRVCRDWCKREGYAIAPSTAITPYRAAPTTAPSFSA